MSLCFTLNQNFDLRNIECSELRGNLVIGLMPRIDAVPSDVRPLFTRSRAFAFYAFTCQTLDEVVNRIELYIFTPPQAGRAQCSLSPLSLPVATVSDNISLRATSGLLG